MEKDLLYIFDKNTYKRYELGEIQAEFNMSLTIDGTNDSCQMIVMNFDSVAIEPYTICWHKKTNTWWIVNSDKVERNASEIGFVYTHELQLDGAIELFNARDLTDCGFNSNRYTIEDYLDRLIYLSNFDFKGEDILYDTNIDLSRVVDFVKTFENYSLLSAFREFLDAFNCCAKLSFATTKINNETYINKAVITILQKTGDMSNGVYDIEYFNGVEERKNYNKESFGTCVVSNAENVVSNAPKTFPSVGTIRLSSTTNEVTPQNALIRLPSNVFKGNWIKMAFRISVRIRLSGVPSDAYFSYTPFNKNSLENGIDTAADVIKNATGGGESAMQEFLNGIQSEKDNIMSLLNQIGCVTMYENNKIVPVFNGANSAIEIKKGDNVPYLTKMSHAIGQSRIPFIFTDKNTKQMLQYPLQGISWERGSNVINGFEFLSSVAPGLTDYSISQSDTDYRGELITTIYEQYLQQYGGRIQFIVESEYRIDWHYVSFIVNYIPMSDLKIKVDNQRTKKDIHLYNQNGKITDNFALSKLINSYSKEISSDNISKNKTFTNINDIPKVGAIVKNGNQDYVINNISKTFYQCESNVLGDFNYFIDCEFNMSKNVSTKSILVNPNTNIRDYGIPQNFNVKRKQVYRDYYELNYTLNSDHENEYFLKPNDIFNFGHTPINISFIATIMVVYSEPIGDEGEESDTWYYQLETTNYNMNKMFYSVLDFNDNNIIGYGSQNVYSGFDISRIFTGSTDVLNTPISYVDDNGEFLHTYINLSTIEQLELAYQTYLDEIQASNENKEKFNYNNSVFIPSEIFEYVDNKIYLEENNYKKDALEIPVFEYGCQVEDSDDVLIGDNILLQDDKEWSYLYSYVVGDNLTINSVSTNYMVIESGATLSINHGVYLTFGNTQTNSFINFSLYSSISYDVSGAISLGSITPFTIGKDVAVFRHAFNNRTKEQKKDLMFIAKKVPQGTTASLRLILNHYKLK